MTSPKFTLTPMELAFFHKCLSSKICIRIFKALLVNKTLNISAISRKVGCTNRDAVQHLKNLSSLGTVEEEFHSGLHTFTLKEGDFTELMRHVVELLEV